MTVRGGPGGRERDVLDSPIGNFDRLRSTWSQGDRGALRPAGNRQQTAKDANDANDATRRARQSAGRVLQPALQTHRHKKEVEWRRAAVPVELASCTDGARRGMWSASESDGIARVGRSDEMVRRRDSHHRGATQSSPPNQLARAARKQGVARCRSPTKPLKLADGPPPPLPVPLPITPTQSSPINAPRDRPVLALCWRRGVKGERCGAGGRCEKRNGGPHGGGC